MTLRKGRDQSSHLTSAHEQENRVIALAASQEMGISRQDVIDLLKCEPQVASNLLLRLKRQKRLLQLGTYRWARYIVFD